MVSDGNMGKGSVDLDANSKPGAVDISGLLLAVALSVVEFVSFKPSVAVDVEVESSKVDKKKVASAVLKAVEVELSVVEE